MIAVLETQALPEAMPCVEVRDVCTEQGEIAKKCEGISLLSVWEIRARSLRRHESDVASREWQGERAEMAQQACALMMDRIWPGEQWHVAPVDGCRRQRGGRHVT